MWKTALAYLVLAGLLSAFSPAGPAVVPGQDGERKIAVGEEGIKLYPRFNKSLTPIGVLEEGQILIVLREFKAWKQVQLEGSGQKGWIAVAVEKQKTTGGKLYDTVADPATTGLVARGWSRDYAASHGADFAEIERIKNRTLSADRYLRFLEGEEE